MQRASWKETGIVLDSDEEDISSLEPSQVVPSTSHRQPNNGPVVEEPTEKRAVATRPIPPMVVIDVFDVENVLAPQEPVLEKHLVARPVERRVDGLGATDDTGKSVEVALNVSDSDKENDMSAQARPAFSPPTADSVVAHSVGTSPRGLEQLQFLEAPEEYWRRNLRQRTEIQKHPYALENQMYKKSLQNRGVRPVYVVGESQVESQNQQESMAENHVSPESSQNTLPRRQFESSSPRRVRQISPADGSDTPLSSPPSFFSEDEDLPELSDLLRPHKRRKFGNWRPHKLNIGGTSRLATARLPIEIPTPTPVNPPDVSPHPRSPLIRSVKKIRPRTRKFQVPHPIEALTSSNAQSTRRNEPKRISAIAPITIESDSDDPLVHTQRRIQRDRVISTTSDGRASMSDQETSSSSNNSAIVSKFAKRLKGVLPRSWLQLDLQRRDPKPKSPPRHRAGRDAHPELAKGVAQRRTGPSNRTPYVLPQSDSEDSPESAPAAGNPSNLQARNPKATMDSFVHQDYSPVNDDDPGSGMEYDAVDRMVSETRKRLLIGSTNRQRKIPELVQVHGERHKATSTQTHLPSKPSRVPHKTYVSRLKSKKPSPVKLGILDADNEEWPRNSLPSFIRVAMRQARKRKDFARSSPIGKFVRLQTREDTVDANEQLGRWLRNDIGQKALVLKPRQRTSTNKHPNTNRLNSVSAQSKLLTPGRPSRLLDSTGTKALLGSTAVEYRQETSVGKKHKARRKPASFRTAQLESLETEHVQRSRRVAFHESLRKAEQEFRLQKHGTRGTNVRLEQFLQLSKPLQRSDEAKIGNADDSGEAVKASSRRRRRKHESFRLDVETNRFRQDDPLPPAISPNVQASTTHLHFSSEAMVLKVAHSLDWDVKPLLYDPCVHFNPESFIGSGEFKTALRMNHRNLGVSSDELNVDIGNQSIEWSAWGERLSNDLHGVFLGWQKFMEAGPESLTKNEENEVLAEVNFTTDSFRYMINACSDHLSFSDPVDRSAFATFVCNTAGPLLQATQQFMDNIQNDRRQVVKALLRSLTLQVCFVAQAKAIAPTQSDLSNNLLLSGAEMILEHCFQHGQETISDFLASQRSFLAREAGVLQREAHVEGIVALYHILGTDGSDTSFWVLFGHVMARKIQPAMDLNVMESCWKLLFHILPLTEIDESGRAIVGMRFQKPTDDWKGVKASLDAVLKTYLESPAARTAKFNNYIKVLMRRCHILISGWNWQRCDGIIGSLFDFFARNKLELLQNEHYLGTPAFLEDLGSSPSLDVLPNDNSFQIFLKILALGLRGMSKIYDAKKINSVIWRCIPNHGRTYHKESELEQTDLDALRNHHQLLSTLYGCSQAPKYRSKLLRSIQELVDHARSHQEICRLNVLSWGHLARYELVKDKNVELLNHFASWMRDMIDTALDQFKLARTEVEAQFQATDEANWASISANRRQRTITKNQTQVVETLEHVTLALKGAVKATKEQKNVAGLLETCGIDKIFILSSEKSCTQLLTHVLEIYNTYLDLSDVQEEFVTLTQNKNPESQEWDDMDMVEYVSLDFVQSHIFTLLSDHFANERMATDKFTTSLIDTWVRILTTKVRRGETSWSMYLESAGRLSWESLMDSARKAKFRLYFYAKVLTSDQSAFDKHRKSFLSAWLVSLVERDTHLKFQHILTAAILNATPGDAMTQNLPFYRLESGKYEISFLQLKQRRLSLISSLLANIQRVCRRTTWEARDTYASILKAMTETMKQNYDFLQRRNEGTGQYVGFVQDLVQFLQQYTSGITPIDPFFTDIRTFPLPRNDPEYIISRIKSYTPDLTDSGGITKLGFFLLGAGERAAKEKTGNDFTLQLLSAASDTSVGFHESSLADALLEIILPSYLELVFRIDGIWILSMPMMIAMEGLVEKLGHRLDTLSAAGRGRALHVVRTVLNSLCRACAPVLEDLTLLGRHYGYPAVRQIVRILTALIPSVNLLQRVTGNRYYGAQQLEFMRLFTLLCAQTYLAVDSVVDPDLLLSITSAGTLNESRGKERDDAMSNLQKHLQTHWYVDLAGRCFVKKGGGHLDEVDYTVSGEAEDMITVIEDFHHGLARMQAY